LLHAMSGFVHAMFACVYIYIYICVFFHVSESIGRVRLRLAFVSGDRDVGR
jgi:hypothetical protein